MKPEPSPRPGMSSSGASSTPSCGLWRVVSITSTCTTAGFTRWTMSANVEGAPKPRGAWGPTSRPPLPAT